MDTLYILFFTTDIHITRRPSNSVLQNEHACCSATPAWSSGLERRYCDGHDRKVDGSTPAKATMRSWIRCFTTIISALKNLTSSKFKKSRNKVQAENSEMKATPARVWIHPMHSAFIAFSRQSPYNFV